MRKVLGIMALAVVTWAGAAQAASLGILVESLRPAAERCGITKEGLTSIARLALRNNRIQVNDDALDYLYVNAIVTQSEPYCYLALSVEINALMQYRPNQAFRAAGQGKGAQSAVASLCTKHFLSVNAKELTKAANDALEQMVKMCLGELEY